MADREKVIKGLENCLHYKGHCLNCPYSSPNCQNDVLADAIKLLKEDCHNCKLECLLQKYDELKEKYNALMKEQEAVKPKYNARTNWFECGSCHYSMTSGMHCKSELIPAYKVGFCAKCGREQKWDA